MNENNDLLSENISSLVAGSEEIRTVADLIKTLRKAQECSALLFVDLAWLGCSGCANRDIATAIGNAMTDYPNVLFRAMPWRETSSYKSVVNRAFTVFAEIVRGHYQLCGNNRQVETYSSNPPWARVHFPQFFFIDGRQIDLERIKTIERLNDANELFNENDELLFFLKRDFYNTKQNDELRNALTGAIYHSGVLLQLLNANLFGLSNLAFQKTAFEQTFACVNHKFVNTSMELSECLAFHRIDRE